MYGYVELQTGDVSSNVFTPRRTVVPADGFDAMIRSGSASYATLLYFAGVRRGSVETIDEILAKIEAATYVVGFEEEPDPESWPECSSTDPADHQGETCPVHETP